MVSAGQYDEARERLRLLSREKKDMLAGDVLLFELLAGKGQYGKARQALEQYAAQSPPRFDIFFGFSKLAVFESRWFDAYVHAQLALNQPNPEEWSEAFSKSVRFEAQLVLMQSCEARGVWLQMPAIFQAVDPVFAEEPRFLSFQGKHAFHTNQIDQAIEYFTKLKEKSESSASPQLIMARLFAAAGKDTEAEEWFRKGLDFSSPEDRCAIEFAQWLLNHDRADETLAILGKLHEDSDVTATQTLRGMAKLARGDFAGAIAALKTVAEQENAPFAARNVMALALTMNDTMDSNNKAYEVALENSRKFPGISEAFATLGWTQLQTGQLEAAELSFSQAVRSGVISRDGAYFLSQFHSRKGNSEEAENFAEAARSGNGLFYFADELK